MFYAHLTPEQQAAIDMDAMKADVDKMTHTEMCRLWRHHPANIYSPYFDSTHPICEYFRHRLFVYFGGFTPEISKIIGW